MKLSTDGSPCTVTNPETGELFMAVPLAEWERLKEEATEAEPCACDCGSFGCRLARRVLRLNREAHKETGDGKPPR